MPGPLVERPVSNRPRGKAAVLVQLSDAGFPVPRFEISPSDLLASVERLGMPLAVRSCATVEDGELASFAGQFATVLNVTTIDQLQQAISTCRASSDSPQVLDYCRRNRIVAASIGMDVIVQKMVAAELSGVAFSIHPINGDDTVLIEATLGTGEQMIAGRSQPLASDHPLLTKWRPAIEQLARGVQEHFGTPQDIEFACDAERLWLLQSRPITRVSFSSQQGCWTNADFRDGGVSASVCSPLMWSLYERAWRQALLGFLHEIRLLSRGEAFETARLFFGRPYWNLAAVKRCLSGLPGYVERRLDEDLSVEPTYQGDGECTPVTMWSVINALPTAWALSRFFRQQQAFDRRFLTDRFEAIMRRHDPLADDPAEALRRLVAEDFMLTEIAYFRTIFAASLAKLDFKNAFPEANEAALVSDLGELRHLAPLRHIRLMKSAGKEDLEDLLRLFRHHQPAGLDVIQPRWDEQRDYVQRLVATTAGSRPGVAESVSHRALAEQLRRLPRHRRATFRAKLDRLRQFLFLREEMRDCSSRIYYLIRRYTLAIADQRHLGEDIFFMTVEEILEDDRANVAARRQLYQRFRNFEAPNEIGSRYALKSAAGQADLSPVLTGLAAGPGRARGVARIARSAAQVSHLEPGVILICPFIDPGWTCVLDRVTAVVTEAGGLLSHAAVICREFGLPTVLGVRGATRRIHDGDYIEVDGDSGSVRMISKQKPEDVT